jgi:hypothetical protein
MPLKLKQWLQIEHPDIFAKWNKLYKKERLEYQRKWQKANYIPMALIHEYNKKAGV